MLPAIPPQTEVVAQPVSWPLAYHEIYLYQCGSQLILHRLIGPVKNDPDCFYFKGDHPDSCLEQIQARHILGRVVFDQMDHLIKLLRELHPTHPGHFRGSTKDGSLTDNIISRNRKLFSQYRLLRQAFLSSGISFTPMKGMWLLINNPLYYSHRLISDMDLLINQSDLKKSITVLIQLGYRQDPSKEWNNKNRTSLHTHHLRPFRANGLAVELHFVPFPGAPKSLTSSLLQSSLPTDHFQVILFHFYRHLGKGDYQEKWLRDLLMLTPAVDLKTLPDQHEMNKLLFSDELCRLVRIIESWYFDAPESIQPVAQEIKDYIDHHFNILQTHQQRIRELRSYFLRFRSLFFTVLPHPDYLRYIDPPHAKSPLLILYFYRWKALSQKALKFLGKPPSQRE